MTAAASEGKNTCEIAPCVKDKGVEYILVALPALKDILPGLKTSVDRCQHSIQASFVLCKLMDCEEKENLIVALLALCGCLLVIVLAIIAFVLRVKNAGFFWDKYM